MSLPQRLCPNCSSPIREVARFCPKCGNPLPPLQQAAPAPVPAPCPRCGLIPRAGAKFCAGCGAAFNNASPALVCPFCHRPNRVGAVFCKHCGGVLTAKKASAPFLTGKLLPDHVLQSKYRIVHKIAQGGMSAVYLAIHESDSSRLYAIKEMSYAPLNNMPPEARQPFLTRMRESFQHEFEILRDAQHPNLPKAYDLFEENGRPYFVMDFIRGKTLEQILQDIPAGQFLNEDRVLGWARQLCDVLDYLHGQNPPIIYRDLKPSNIMEIEGGSEIRLIDFGIARFYKPGKKGDTMRFGTEGYLAPEILGKMDQTSPCTDIYALGVVLHELFTGRDPLTEPFKFPLANTINPKISKRASQALERATRMSPEERPQSACEMLKALFGPTAEFTARAASGKAAHSPKPAQPAKSAQPAQPVPPSKAAPARAGTPHPVVPPQPPAPEKQEGCVLRMRAARGRKKSTATLTRVIPPGVFVQVLPSSAWMNVFPAQFTSAGVPVNFQVEVSPERLSIDVWQPAAEKNSLSHVPGLLRAWLRVHLQLIPGSRLYRGVIHLRPKMGQPEQIEVEVELPPPGFRVFLGWLVALLMMGLELGLIAVVILFLAQSL